MDNYSKVEKLLSNYKMLQISIVNMQEEIKFIDDCGVGGMDYESLPANTNKINSITENAALSNIENIQYLEMQIERLTRQLELLDRTLEGLTSQERKVVTEKYIEGKQWWQVASEVCYSETHVRRIRKKAIDKLVIGIYGQKEDR